MSEPQMDISENEELQKSLDGLITDYFEKGSAVDIYGDASTTADAAVNQAPKGQDDAARGAGRPDQISDVPDKDQDGKRAGTYDADITENEGKEDEPEETNQSPSIDQNSGTGRIKQTPKAPDMKPFKKGEDGMDHQANYERLLKAEQEQIEEAEALRKSEQEAEVLQKAVTVALEPLQKAFDEVKAENEELKTLVKSIAKTPQQPRSVTNITTLEKGGQPPVDPENFSKADKLNAAEECVMEKSIPMEAAIELENTGTIYNPEHRRIVEQKLLAQ